MNKMLCIAMASAMFLGGLGGLAAAEICSQGQLGKAGSPKNWSVYAVAGGGKFVDCRLTIRGRYDVSGRCDTEATGWSTIQTGSSYVQLRSDCVLIGKLVSPSVATTFSGIYTVQGWPSPLGSGTLKRQKPATASTFTFTMLRLP